jgi:hypothetical protein
MRRLLTALALLTVAACGSDAVSFSEPVLINVNVTKSSDVGAASAISGEKSITTETSNPYGKFVNDAMVALGGANPTRIETSSVSLQLGADSKNVTSLEQVFAGDVFVDFLMNTSNNTYNVAQVANPTGTGSVGMTVVFNGSTVAAQDFPQLLTGSFKVVVRGTAAAGYASIAAEPNIQVTLTFEAFK